MYPLGRKINTFNLGSALHNQTGKFEVSTPGGETLYVTCEAGLITDIEWGNPGSQLVPFTVCKIAEPVTTVAERPQVMRTTA